jgi:hypothetical protein
MSQPKRYSIRGFSAALVEEDNGVMVKYSDYELLRQEFSLLAEERYTTIRALGLENERLRKITDTIKLLHTFGLDVNAELDKAKSEAAKGVPS